MNHQASRNYVPRAYPGTVTDFRPSTQYRVLDKPELKWDELAQGGQRVIAIAAYPAVMLLEPYVEDLAQMLTESIDQAVCHHQRHEEEASSEDQHARMS